MTTFTIPSLSPTITRRLSALRRRVRMWFALSGLSLCILLIGAWATLSLGMDYWWRWDRQQRGIILASGILALLAVAWRQLIRPLMQPLSDDALVLRVEATHPQLGQRLINALQFSRLGQAALTAGASPMMVIETIRQGSLAAENTRFGNALSRAFRKSILQQAGAAAVFAAVIIVAFVTPASAGAMRLWFDRNVLLGDAQWPQRTQLRFDEITGPDVTIPRGDDWQVVVEAQGVVPRTVTAEIRPLKEIAGRPGEFAPQGPLGEEELTQVGVDSFRALFRNVLTPFQFRVVGGDAKTQWITVQLVDRPETRDLSLAYQPPAYTGQELAPLPAAQGSYDLLGGGTLQIQAVASKPLRAASLRRGDDEVMPMTITPGDDGEHPRLSATLDSGHLKPGVYSLMLVDAQGLESRRPDRFTLRIVGDRKPEVRGKLMGISGWVTANATIPIDIRMSDDFGITATGLSYQTAMPGAEKGPAVEEPLVELSRNLPQRQVSGGYRFDITPLKLPVGATLAFHVHATDNDIVTGPQRGVSNTFPVTIVTPEELRTELLRREQEQRQEFERLIKDQEDLLTDVRAVMVSLGDAAELPPAQRQLLVRAEKRQRLAGDRCVTIAGHFASILAELINNKLEEPDGTAKRRIEESIVAPLQGLAGGPIPQAADVLDVARKPNISAELRTKALNEAAERQQKLVAEMRQIARFMEKWEGYQEAINLLHEILKAQGDVNAATLRELERTIETGIFD